MLEILQDAIEADAVNQPAQDANGQRGTHEAPRGLGHLQNGPSTRKSTEGMAFSKCPARLPPIRQMGTVWHEEFSYAVPRLLRNRDASPSVTQPPSSSTG